MNIGVAHMRGALYSLFYNKSAFLYLLWMLPSTTRTTPAYAHVILNFLMDMLFIATETQARWKGPGKVLGQVISINYA